MNKLTKKTRSKLRNLKKKYRDMLQLASITFGMVGAILGMFIFGVNRYSGRREVIILGIILAITLLMDIPGFLYIELKAVPDKDDYTEELVDCMTDELKEKGMQLIPIQIHLVNILIGMTTYYFIGLMTGVVV